MTGECLKLAKHRAVNYWPALLVVPLVSLSTLTWAQSGEWVIKTPMPTAREKLTSCVVAENIHVFGGAAGENEPGLNTHQVYDAVADSWTTEQPLPTGRRSLTAAPVDSLCYVIGGRQNFGGQIFDVVEAFNPATGQWSARATDASSPGFKPR